MADAQVVRTLLLSLEKLVAWHWKTMGRGHSLKEAGVQREYSSQQLLSAFRVRDPLVLLVLLPVASAGIVAHLVVDASSSSS